MPPWCRPLALLALLVAPSLGCHDVHFSPRGGEGEILIYDDLYTVSMPDPDHIVAGGYWGSIYYSHDGGHTWKQGESGTKRLIYGISMADAQRGWAVGQLGTILRTEDGGVTWKLQDNPKVAEGVNLFAVEALDANTAWVVGEWGTRIFTDNGGISWQDRSLTIDETHPQFVWLAPVDQDRVRRGEPVFEDVTLNDVDCAPAPSTRCWIIGEFGYIFFSENRGQSWERAEITGGQKFDPIRMPYNVLELSEEDRERLRGFADVIAPQEHLNVEIEPVASAREVQEFGRNRDDPTELFEILEARAQEVRAALEEAGILSDRLRMRGSPPWDWEDFIDDDPDFLERYLRGRTAEHPGVLVHVSQNPYLFTIRFENDQEGFISGLGGVVLYSADGGRRWEYRNTGRKQALFALERAGDRIIGVGEKGYIQVSTDGGKSWQDPGGGFPPIFTFMRDIGFSPGDQRGVIVGQRGMVLRTDDAGLHWERVLPPPVEGGELAAF